MSTGRQYCQVFKLVTVRDLSSYAVDGGEKSYGTDGGGKPTAVERPQGKIDHTRDEQQGLHFPLWVRGTAANCMGGLRSCPRSPDQLFQLWGLAMRCWDLPAPRGTESHNHLFLRRRRRRGHPPG